MHKLMYRFVATTKKKIPDSKLDTVAVRASRVKKKLTSFYTRYAPLGIPRKKITDPNLDTACPAGIPCNKHNIDICMK